MPSILASRREAMASDQCENLGRGLRDVGAAGPVDGVDPGLFEELVILRRDHPADDDEDVARAFALQRLDQHWDEGLVTGRVGRDVDDVDIVLDGLPRRLLQGLE